jgi:predicted GNAT superfamily acetyltransferase
MREVETLQLAIWGSEPSWVVPSHVLYIVAENGGILLGAEVDGKLVGFVLGFLARRGDTLFHASHILGIHPDYQQRGIGAALKWRQRERALEQGLDLMTWTFDPLESRNAYFNLHKLGTSSRTYRENHYGPMEDALNQGLPSDRLLVEWRLRDIPVSPRNGDPATEILSSQGGRPELHLDGVPADVPLAIHIPRDIQALKQEDADAALAWRLAVRQAFSWALDRGYVAADYRGDGYVLLPQ